jgi:hypothetical protein
MEDDHSARSAPRSRRNPPMLKSVSNVSHEDIANRQDMMAMTMQRIETKLDELVKTVGSTGFDEHGAMIGVGIAGDLARLKGRVDRRFGIYDGVTKYAAGATAATLLAVTVIWWLIQNRVDEVLR